MSRSCNAVSATQADGTTEADVKGHEFGINHYSSGGFNGFNPTEPPQVTKRLKKNMANVTN